MDKVFEKIELKMPTTAILTLSLQAHKKNMTLNDHIVAIAVKAAEDVIQAANESAQIVDLEARHG